MPNLLPELLLLRDLPRFCKYDSDCVIGGDLRSELQAFGNLLVSYLCMRKKESEIYDSCLIVLGVEI